MVAGGEVDAEGRGKLLEGRDQAVEVALGAVEEVAGKEDDIGIERAACTMRRQKRTPLMVPRCRSLSRTAVRPRQDGGQVGQLDGDAADADDTGVEQAVEAGENGQSEENARRTAGGLRRDLPARCARRRHKPGQPAEAGRPEEDS